MRIVLIIIMCVVGVLYMAHEAKGLGNNLRQQQEARMKVVV